MTIDDVSDKVESQSCRIENADSNLASSAALQDCMNAAVVA
jgi:hypothetical protein